jgi:hypothetical protein
MVTKVKKVTSAPVGLREAAHDRRLFGLTLSMKQLELVDLIAGLELVICAAGRQGGKSLLAALMLVHNQLLRPDLDELAGGSIRHCLCIANSREQASIVLRHARALVERSPLLRSRLVTAKDDRLIFSNAGVVIAMPCSDRLQRGLSASAIVLDEFAHFITDSDGPRVAERIWTAVRPSLATYGAEARLLAISTPFGDNHFSRLYTKALNGELGPKATAFSATTAEMNPRVSADFLEQERILLGPSDYAREYEAQFGTGGGSFFEEDELQAVTSKRRESLPEDGRGWVVAIDPSSGGGDAFGCVVVGHDARPGYEGRLLVGHVQRWAPRKPRSSLIARRTRKERDLWVDSVLDAVAVIAKRFHAGVVSDQHVPGVVVDELNKRGVPRVKIVPWSPTSKSEAFQSLRARIATERIEITSDEQLLSELRRVRTRYRSGSSVVEIARVGDSHGDLCLALAAGVALLDSGRGVSTPAHVTSAIRRLPGYFELPPTEPGTKRRGMTVVSQDDRPRTRGGLAWQRQRREEAREERRKALEGKQS